MRLLDIFLRNASTNIEIRVGGKGRCGVGWVVETGREKKPNDTNGSV